jgi:hypothetical protein
MPKVRTVCVQRLPASISSSNSRLVAASSMPVGYALTATGFGVPPGSRSVPRRTTPNAPLAQQPARPSRPPPAGAPRTCPPVCAKRVRKNKERKKKERKEKTRGGGSE